LAQEGHIAMWKAISSYRPESGVKLSTHLMNKARWRIAEVAVRGTFTGKASQAGKKHSAGTKKHKNTEQCVDMTLSDFDFECLDNIEEASLAYHYGEIIQAINKLPLHQREKVYNRFWGNSYDPKNSSWWHAKRIGAKDRLREQLGHLETL